MHLQFKTGIFVLEKRVQVVHPSQGSCLGQAALRMRWRGQVMLCAGLHRFAPRQGEAQRGSPVQHRLAVPQSTDCYTASYVDILL